MFILKFFASIILLGFFCLILFILVGFLLASNFLKNLNQSLEGKFKAANENDNAEEPSTKDIPVAIQCPVCGTYHAEMPKDRLCSCGTKL